MIFKIVGDRLFTGSFDGSIKIFDAANLIADKDDGNIDYSNENANDLYQDEVDMDY